MLLNGLTLNYMAKLWTICLNKKKHLHSTSLFSNQKTGLISKKLLLDLAKGKIVGFHNFSPFPKMFSTAVFPGVEKIRGHLWFG